MYIWTVRNYHLIEKQAWNYYKLRKNESNIKIIVENIVFASRKLLLFLLLLLSTMRNPNFTQALNS